MATIINLGSAPGEPASPPIVIIDPSDELSVTLPPLTELSNTLDGLLDVDTSGVQDESVLMYDDDTDTWIVSKSFNSHVIEGGEY